MKSFTLSVDMLGSETKAKDILEGLNQSILRNLNFKFQLFGNEKNIKKKIERLQISQKIKAQN